MVRKNHVETRSDVVGINSVRVRVKERASIPLVIRSEGFFRVHPPMIADFLKSQGLRRRNIEVSHDEDRDRAMRGGKSENELKEAFVLGSSLFAGPSTSKTIKGVHNDVTVAVDSADRDSDTREPRQEVVVKGRRDAIDIQS